MRPLLAKSRTDDEVSEEALRLGVTRATIEEWIAKVAEIVGSEGAAWRFLTDESPFFEGDPRRPIDVLMDGDLQAVLEAADSQGDAFT